MTYQNIICPICKLLVGKAHTYEINRETARHIFKEHKEVWKELTEATAKMNKIREEMKEKYGINIGGLIQYYRNWQI
jgi:diadenosine tetraphosphate (Ap4A) HIT family hydrolase